MSKIGSAQTLFLLASATLLAGCGPSASDPGPGGVSVEEAQALNEAADMLDVNAMDMATEGSNQAE